MRMYKAKLTVEDIDPAGKSYRKTHFHGKRTYHVQKQRMGLEDGDVCSGRLEGFNC